MGQNRQWVSTASGRSHLFVDSEVARLQPGLVLNLGSGWSRPSIDGRTVLNVDRDWNVLSSESNSVVADSSSLPFRGGCLDGALLKDILEHVDDPIGTLREVNRVCRPAAMLTLTVPRAIPRAVWADPTHIRGFTAKAIVTALTLSGWRVSRRPRRMGSIPLAGRIPFLLRHAETVLRVPVLGHRMGTNWIVRADKPRREATQTAPLRDGLTGP